MTNYTDVVKQHISCQYAEVSGDGYKFEAVVVSDDFTGETIIKRHKRVYAALDAFIKSGELHALSIRAYTPSEWEAQSKD